jgi:oligoendopeptidase F
VKVARVSNTLLRSYDGTIAEEVVRMTMPYPGNARLARKPRARLLLALACLLAPSSPALATTSASPGDSQSVDPARYFATPAAELTARAAIKQRFDALEASNTPLDMETAFHTLESLFGECLDHYAYRELIAAQNASDRAARAARDDVEDLCGDIAGTAKEQVRTAPADARWAQPYAYLAARSARAEAHALPAAAKPMAAAADTALDRLEHAYRLATQGAGFTTMKVDDRVFNVADDFHTLMALPDEAVRKRAWTLHHDAMLQRKPALADALIGIAVLRDGLAVTRGYASAPEQAYAGMGIGSKEVSTALRALQSHASSFAAYQALSKTPGDSSPAPWNDEAPRGSFSPPAMSMEQVRQIAMRATARLGPEHVAQIGAVLDPAGGRMDFASQLGSRKRDAFSITAPHYTSVLYVGHRRGDTESDVEVVHEGTHAVHGQLMNAHGTSPLFRHGTAWLEETFAILDEFLYRDQLVSEATTIDARDYYQRGLLRDLALQLFISAEEAQLEAAIHQGVHDGTVRGPDDLDTLVVKMRTLHEGSFSGHPDQDTTWAGKRLFYQDPLYLTNYLFAGLVAVKLYALSAEDPGFAARYARVQARGFDREPGKVVEELIGRPLDWAQLADDDVTLFNARVAELNDPDPAQ